MEAILLKINNLGRLVDLHTDKMKVALLAKQAAQMTKDTASPEIARAIAIEGVRLFSQNDPAHWIADNILDKVRI